MSAKKYLPILLAVMMSFMFMYNCYGEKVQTQTQHVTVVVRTGDTVWGLAEHFKSEHEDVRAVVARIYEINDLTGKMLMPGESILIPVQKQVKADIVAKASE